MRIATHNLFLLKQKNKSKYLLALRPTGNYPQVQPLCDNKEIDRDNFDEMVARPDIPTSVLDKKPWIPRGSGAYNKIHHFSLLVY